MNEPEQKELLSLLNSYVNDQYIGDSKFSFSFVYNNPIDNKNVLNPILDNLCKCDEFLFSVAFINDSGLLKLKMILKELEAKGVKGKILTTNYLNFSSPKALNDILKLSNIELRMFYINESDISGFHTKTYIFRFKDTYKIIIGSSNLTSKALLTSNEWNNEFTCQKEGKIFKDIKNEFDRLWNMSLPYISLKEIYEKNYLENIKNTVKVKDKYYNLKPNNMQLAFIERLNKLTKSGQKRGLFIAATGTGKTYASAFALRDLTSFKVNKLLFITHRETILKQALRSYQRIFGEEKKMAIFSGNNHDIKDAEFIFATYDTIRKEKYYSLFKKDEFDFVIIDEVHKVGDNHYQDIINYFRPKFLLGMSATPDRNDGYDLYKLFDYNIIYEIRLEQALEANMLTPFSYFGISDINLEGVEIDDLSKFNLLTSDERVKHIISEANYYGYSGSRVKGLIFVSRIDVGKELSKKFNERGYKTVFLNGENSQSEREKAIQLLSKETKEGEYLDYIFTVDIFNEGVDIPPVNQVIFLRPTESSIIFTQQLGRGLRLFNNKEYVVILDFIGNYKKNYLIPLAFTKKVSNKGSIINKTINPFLPGTSTIQFDEISKERIFKSIALEDVLDLKKIKSEYIDINNRLGKIPSLIEFDQNSKISARVFLDLKENNCYFDFLRKNDNENYHLKLSEEELNILRYFSYCFISGKRIHEGLVLKCVIENSLNVLEDSFKKYNLELNDKVVASLNAIFNGAYAKPKEKITNLLKIDKVTHYISLSDSFKDYLGHSDFLSSLKMLVEYMFYSNKTYFNKPISESDQFNLHQEYTRFDVSRLINLTKNCASTMYGYQNYKEVGIIPIFVSYHKMLKEDDSTNYEDHFINKSEFIWFSRSRRTLNSSEIKGIIDGHKKEGEKLLLFVQKSNSNLVEKNNNGFYFLGECSIEGEPINTKMKNGLDIVRFKLRLNDPINDSLYEYLTLLN